MTQEHVEGDPFADLEPYEVDAENGEWHHAAMAMADDMLDDGQELEPMGIVRGIQGDDVVEGLIHMPEDKDLWRAAFEKTTEHFEEVEGVLLVASAWVGHAHDRGEDITPPSEDPQRRHAVICTVKNQGEGIQAFMKFYWPTKDGEPRHIGEWKQMPDDGEMMSRHFEGVLDE